MKLTSKPLAFIIFAIIFGGITFTTLMGWWRTKTSKVPEKYSVGEAAGQYNPADIRGSYAFGDISRLFAIPLEELSLAFALPAEVDASAFQVKSLESQYPDLLTEIGTASVRLFVAWYKGLPYEPAEETYLPLPAINLLKEKALLTPEQLVYLENHTVDLASPEEPVQEPAPTAAPGIEPTVAPTPAPTAEHVQAERKVSGKTTFQQLLDWGVSQAAIEQALGEKMPPPATVIKDYATSKGEEFSALKTTLQALVDQIQP
jgi:hypothetical protein